MAVVAGIIAFGPTILDITFSRTIGPIVRHISYPFKCNSNVAKLKQELEKVEDTRESVKNEVDAEIRDGGIIEKRVEKWITQMQKSVERLRGQLDAEEERIQKKCFGGLCPNIKARYQLSKQAEKEAADLNDLRNRRPEFQTLTYQPDLPRIQDTTVKDYEAFDSRSYILKAIMDALLISNSQVIGVYGTGGVGKTMLVQEVARQAGRSFDEVVMASVGSNPEIKDIQAKIVGELGMRFVEESVEARASRLREALKRKKKVLVVLDNLWEKLNLTELGIPSKDEHVGCKILLTSRELDVLSNGMNCQKTIRVSALSSEEAWYLFEKKAGDCSQNPELLSIAQNICEKCGGLPLAISTVATALKDKSLSDWKDALRDLKRPAPRNFTGVSSEVYCALQLSYDHLASQELKDTFLLCCQMIYSPLEYLVKYGMALSLFPEVFSIEEAQDRVKSLVDHLQASSLLEEKDGSIVIHDLLRDVGLSIASRDENVFFRQPEFDMKIWHKKHDLRSLKRISLQRCTQLPEELNCPELDFFSLVCEDRHLKIPDNIFKSTKRLKVLALTGHSLPFLPSSLVYLQNLQTLCLHDSELGDISIVGELKNLEFLSFRGSRLEHLPAEVGNLFGLISLDLTDCHFLQVIPPNILLKLSCLEELWVENSFDQWENASLVELKQLPCLTNLAVHIRDHQVIPAELLSKKLKRYKIYIGSDWDWDAFRTSSNTLKLKLNADFHDECYGVRILMRTVEELYLDQVKGVDNILSQLNSEGFPRLKHLHIQNNSEIKHLVVGSSNWVSSKHAFPVLESLVLNHLVSLEKIHSGKISTHCFSRLRTLEVSRCPKIKYLFTCSVAKCLSNLQEMEVVDCMNLEMIVAEEDEATDDKIDFVQLRQLTLSRLPQLKSFLSKEKNTLTTEQITEEDNLMIASLRSSLFDAKVMFPSLEYLSLSCIEVENIWNDQSVGLSSWPRKLTNLSVEGCGNLLYLFPPSMVTSLVQLQSLEVRGCKCVREIVLARAEIEKTTSPFPDLHSLELKDLPKLVTFCIGNFIELSSLKDLQIDQCPRMKAFITSALYSDAANSTFFDKKVSVPNLETLEIHNMHHLKMIWHPQFHPNSFCKLKILRITYVRELQSVFPSSSFLTQFCYLEKLVVRQCDYLETVFDKQMLIHPQESNSTASSSSCQLHTISVKDLQNLKYIWNCIEISDNQGIVSFHNLRKVKALRCQTLEALFPVSVAKYLPHLKVLQVRCCDGLKEIVAKEEEEGVNRGVVPVFEFHGLTVLELINLPKVSTFYPGTHISEWPVLKSLDLRSLPQMNIFEAETTEVSGSQPFLPFAKILPNLEELSLSIYHVRELPAGLFHQLKCLRLFFEDDKSEVFPFDLLHKFPHLETLDVVNGNFNDLSPREEEEDVGSNSPGRTIFQQLRNFYLTKVDGLNHLWNPDSQLDHLQNMETLAVFLCYDLIELAPSAASFQNLTVLDVYGCKGLQYILSPTTANSLVQLTDMSVRDCDKVTEIVASEGDEIDDSIIFTKLARLVLVALPSLSCFCSAKHSLKFPQLTWLVVEQCPHMMGFLAGGGALSTPKLKGVQLQEYNESSYCRNGNVQMLFKKMVGFLSLEHLNLSEFPWLRDIWNAELPVKRFRDLKSLVVEGGSFSKAISSELQWFLNHLEVLRVRNCGLVDEVLDTDKQKQDWLLPSLTQLYLTNLPSLRRLWNERLEGISCFQNFKVVEIRNCGSLKHIFTRSMAMVLVHLEKMKVKDCISLEQIISEGVEDATLSDNNIIFPHLSSLVLERLPNVTSFCFKSDALELPSMKELRIEQCPSMKTFITDSSDSVDAYSTFFDKEVGLPNLEKLEIHSMEHLKMIWHPQFHPTSFCKLKVLSVRDGKELRNIFPSNSFLTQLGHLEELFISNCESLEMVFGKQYPQESRDLPFLQELSINNCDGLKVIVAKEEEGVNAAAPLVEFPRLTSLQLCKLPKVSTFYSGMHTLEWPKLKILHLRLLPQMNVFDLNSPIFSFAKILPNLEGLSLSSYDVRKFPADLFHHIKCLVLSFDGDESTVFPVELLHASFPRLETLHVVQGNFKDLFPREEEDGGSDSLGRKIIQQLRHLVLTEVGRLNRIWNPDSPLDDLQNIEALVVSSCYSLIELAPSVASFQNLKILLVTQCKGLQYILSPTTAKSLVQLGEISVRECDMVTEIVTKDEADDTVDDIIFTNLFRLVLVGCPELSCFCSAKHSLKFPLLGHIVVEQCPKMMIFSRGGVLKTPILKGVKLAEEEDESEGRWDRNLNRTVEMLFKERL